MFTIPDIHLFSFPINLIIGVAIFSLPVWWRFPRKMVCAVSAFAALALSAVVLGLCGREGVNAIVGSWPFAAVMAWVLLALAGAVVGRCGKIRKDRQIMHRDIPFLMTHLGMWLALFAGYFGSCDNLATRLGVHQPWSWVVITGIVMMLIGAVTMLPRHKGNGSTQNMEERL